MPAIFSLEDKVAIVTGASRGIGRAIALSLAEHGADLVLAARKASDLESVAAEVRNLGRKALAVPTDVAKVSDIVNLVKACSETFGKIDVLVNSAGISPIYKRADKVTEEEWDQITDINLKGTFFCCVEAGKVMIEQKRGKIINIASAGGLVALPRLSVYSSSKGGVIQVTRA
ncbi:MAG: SDR family NAD(P)-dependent oxidoreductase, partial [Dehalococcoidia bacterium]|nr:SDR family NAD(P)-dependent oxidoreductase [Dehalococcoidia bacterium]